MERRFFETEAEAKTYAAQKEIELLNQGKEGATFPARLRVAAQQAMIGCDLTANRLPTRSILYVKHLEATARSVSLELAIRELIENRRAAEQAHGIATTSGCASRGFAQRSPTAHWRRFPRLTWTPGLPH
jgi:hypothetical protein